MAVLLVGSCPPMVEVFDLGRECGPVYALLWESAFKDVSGKGKSAQGGTTAWSVKGIANQCGLGKATVISAVKKLLDAGFIQYAGWAWGNGSPKRRWRVTHPKHLEAVRYAISVMGLPSLKYHEPTTNDTTESSEGKAWETDPADRLTRIAEGLGAEKFERDQERLERDFSSMGGNSI